MENNKKLFLGIGIGVLVTLLLGATMFIGSNDDPGTSSTDPNAIVANAQKESAEITKEQMKELEEINMTQYLDYYNGSELKVVLVARPTCSYCQVAEPIIRKIAKDYDLNIYYLNTDNFQDDDQAKFVNHNEMFNEGYGTPILLAVSNGEIVSNFEGLSDTSYYIQFFKSIGLIK